jgi:nucleotide-binding universal stress UspA family protein
LAKKIKKGVAVNQNNEKNMVIRKMLFVTKFEELGFGALQSLLPLKKSALEHVIFMNVIERDRVAMQRGVGYKKGEERKLREQANIRFIDWAENLFEQGMEVGAYIVVGNLVPQVIDAAEKENADLLVIGRRSRKMMEVFYSGADITELLRRIERPVLVYKHRVDTGSVLEKPFDKPLYAVDWSPASMKAVEYLKNLKDVIHTINVVHVANPKELKGTSGFDIQQLRKEKREKLDKICEVFTANGIEATSHVYVGDTIEEIEKAAGECKSTMIVMGSSGKSSWRERWIGSTPRYIAEKSQYPALIIPYGGDK